MLSLQLISLSLLAQEDSLMIYPSKESDAYHLYRLKMSVPSYGLQKIKNQLATIKSDDDDNQILNKKFYTTLSLREKFTYHMIHFESYSQNCDAVPPILDEQKKIFAHFPDSYYEYTWSKSQTDFLKNNRDSVIAIMKEIISRSGRVGLNFKNAILEINAKEMVLKIISNIKSNVNEI